MRHETAMSAALKKADPAAARMQAYTLATELLRRVGGERFAAPPLALKKFLDAIRADEDLLRGCALGFLQFVAGDMKGSGASHIGRETRSDVAASSPDRDGAGQSMGDAHAATARPVREPSRAYKEAAGVTRLKMAEGVLKTFRVRDGRAIGRLYRSEISGLIGENWRENAILDRVRNIAPPSGLNDARIDTYVSNAQLSRIIAEVDRGVDAINAA